VRVPNWAGSSCPSNQHHLFISATALRILTTFRERLGKIRSGAQLREVIRETCDRVVALQGAPDDRPYRAKTICQIATLLRRNGWVAAAQELVHSKLAQDAADAFLQTELVMCAIARADWSSAERLLRSAQDTGMAAEAMYAALITAYGRAGRLGDAERIFRLATEHRLAANHVHSAMVAAYVREGLLARARRAVQAAEAAAAGVMPDETRRQVMRTIERAGSPANTCPSRSSTPSASKRCGPRSANEKNRIERAPHEEDDAA
jgi:pentatricopeptide repeat protein